MGPEQLTTLVLPVPEADDAVGRWRAKHDWSARAGVPAHITVLGPFLPPQEVTRAQLDRLRDLLATWPPFAFRLATVERLSDVVYLPPEPVTPFRQLTDAIQRAWPEAPRFGRGFDRPRHHLTVARDRGVYDEVRAELGGRLPIEATAQETVLLEKHGEGDVRTIASFPFGA